MQFTVFTKPWKTMPLAELGEKVHKLGFHGIELPVRPGFQVEPQNVRKDLPLAVKTLANQSVRITSVAGPTDEATIATCAEQQIPLIRIMLPVQGRYLDSFDNARKEFDRLLPLLHKYKMNVGVQNHSGRFVTSSGIGMHHLLQGYDPRRISAVWDCAHNALQGEDADLALDAVWSYLSLVNFKNGYWKRQEGPEAQPAKWRIYWTTGKQGQADWQRVADELKKRQYAGLVCLTAEYSDEAAVDRQIAEDIAYAKQVFASDV